MPLSPLAVLGRHGLYVNRPRSGSRHPFLLSCCEDESVSALCEQPLKELCRCLPKGESVAHLRADFDVEKMPR